MKYFWLLWSGSPRFSYPTNYLTTEGNVLRGINRVAAPAVSGTYNLINRGTGGALDMGGSSLSDGGAAIGWVAHGGLNQQWILTTTGGNTVVTNRRSGKVLQVSGSSTADGAALVQWSHNGSTVQQWALQPTGDGYYRLANRNSGKVAQLASTANGAAVVQQPTGTATSQQWQLVKS
jgi:mannosyl-oligosaccharide alpha-1,2-mannosidase